MKKIGLLFTVIIVAMLFAVSANAATEGYYTYEVENGEATIVDIDDYLSGDVDIPSTLGGYPVTAIGDGAFYGSCLITALSIPEGVETIGRYAFDSCFLVEEITVPDSLVVISKGAFYNCYLLEKFIISEKTSDLETIEADAFACCISLKEFIVPESVISIGNTAFLDCHSLKKLVINNSETDIGDNIACAAISPKDISTEEWVEKYVLAISSMILENGSLEPNELMIEWSEKYTYFHEKDLTTLTNVTIYGHEPSTAKTFAEANGIPFKNLGEIKEEVVDNSTGVKAEYGIDVFAEDADMIITEGSKNANIIFSDKFGKYTSYDISFVVDGEKVQPNGTVTIKIPLPDSYNANSVKVFYVDDNGNKTKLDSKIENGYIVFETDHFSEYVIVDESSKIEEPVEPDDTDEPEVSDEPSNDKDSCTCNCHKGGIAGFFFKIINFFQKLFGKNKICVCGTKH